MKDEHKTLIGLLLRVAEGGAVSRAEVAGLYVSVMKQIDEAVVRDQPRGELEWLADAAMRLLVTRGDEDNYSPIP